LRSPCFPLVGSISLRAIRCGLSLMLLNIDIPVL
jgi:hypothetical protein